MTEPRPVLIFRIMSNYPTISSEQAAAAFRALGNPQRLRLFQRLMACCVKGQACCDADSAKRCVGDLGEDVDVAPSTVSHHLKELRSAGLIHMKRRGRHIECWVEPDTLQMFAAFFARAEAKAKTRSGKRGKR